ncbi:RidA family protein [Natrarchaeobius chitinivorans]|uniref:RidA family protein n=1 Tax=Natrarchaeobius chitinivorans TaxID=1679083 RepID=A0A3N6MGX3_NATCH|nr:RidA family protein [Natrarchaeobius chitinivorans]RQG94831.1 RidA family protein [Natrarchaeobius chitinivorans]
MKKTVIDPAAGNELVEDADSVDETAYSRGVVVDHDGYKRVYCSGVTPVETADDSVEEQTREVLEIIQDLLADQGGTMDDVVRVRIFVQDVVGDEFTTVHEVRGQFFDRDHFPASTLVQIDTLVRGNIEIEAEAIVPEDDWDVETIDAE